MLCCKTNIREVLLINRVNTAIYLPVMLLFQTVANVLNALLDSRNRQPFTEFTDDGISKV